MRLARFGCTSGWLGDSYLSLSNWCSLLTSLTPGQSRGRKIIGKQKQRNSFAEVIKNPAVRGIDTTLLYYSPKTSVFILNCFFIKVDIRHQLVLGFVDFHLGNVCHLTGFHRFMLRVRQSSK